MHYNAKNESNISDPFVAACFNLFISTLCLWINIERLIFMHIFRFEVFEVDLPLVFVTLVLLFNLCFIMRMLGL